MMDPDRIVPVAIKVPRNLEPEMEHTKNAGAFNQVVTPEPDIPSRGGADGATVPHSLQLLDYAAGNVADPCCMGRILRC